MNAFTNVSNVNALATDLYASQHKRIVHSGVPAMPTCQRIGRLHCACCILPFAFGRVRTALIATSAVVVSVYRLHIQTCRSACSSVPSIHTRADSEMSDLSFWTNVAASAGANSSPPMRPDMLATLHLILAQTVATNLADVC